MIAELGSTPIAPATIATWLHAVLTALFTLIVLRRPTRVTSVTLAWILAFLLLPFAGVLVYLLIGYRAFERRRRSKPSPARRIEALHRIHSASLASSEGLDPDAGKVARLAARLTEFPVLGHNRVTIFEEAFETYREISRAIGEARHHVHLEYYIFQPDETGRHFRDLLVEKARQGVQCRLLVDAVGSARLGKAFLEPLRAAGVEVAEFWPARIYRPWGFHLRNHRKLVVVDGQVGFVGSQNIGNEYLRWNHRGLTWRDAQVRIEGPAVAQLQSIFLEDWEFTVGRPVERMSEHFPAIPARGDSCVQALPTGPSDARDSSFEMILMTLFHSARARVTMVTPYFIPTLPILLAIETAARRGVGVDILVPRRSDNWLVDRARRSWYRDVLAAGARLYEHDRTFLHAKVVTVDERMALIGSANMDERSFRLNFECSVLLYDPQAAAQLVASFDGIRGQSREILPSAVESQSFAAGVLDGVFRVFSPLL